MRARGWADGIAACGALLAASAVVHLLVLESPSATPAHRLITLLLVGGSGVGVFYGGYRHRSEPLPEERYPRIAGWLAGSAVLTASLGVVSLFVASGDVTPVELFEAIQVSGSVGLAAGLLVGGLEARAIVNAEMAARAEAEADALAAEQERLEELNDLLRHHILNGTHIISGRARQLQSTTGPETASELETIDRRAQTMATLVRHVRTIANVEREGAASVEVDLQAAVESAVTDLELPADVTIETFETAPAVRANMLDEAVYLLCDGVAKRVDIGGRVDVDCEWTDERATLSITGRPADVSQIGEDSVFEPVGSNEGIEFYLAKEIIDGYGDLRLQESCGETLRFDLVLDRH